MQEGEVLSRWSALFGSEEETSFKHIMSSFMKATGLRVTIIDEHGETVCVSDDFRMTEFCQQVQSTHFGCFKCKRSYRLAGIDSMTYNGPYIFRCHAGLVCWAAPIVVSGEQVASIICGQVLMWKPENFFWEEVKTTTRDLQIDLDSLIEAAKKLDVVSAQSVQGASEMLYLVANELASMSENLSVHRSALRAQQKKMLREKQAVKEIEYILNNRTHYSGFILHQDRVLRAVRKGYADEIESAMDEMFSGFKTLHQRDMRIYANELIINMMKAALEGGALAENLMIMCDRHLKNLMISSFNPLDAHQWLTSVGKDFALMVKQGRTLDSIGVVTRAANFVRTNCSKRLTVADVADAVYMSPSGLTKLFRRETGCTVSEFINKVMIEETKIILGDPKYSVSDVAEEMGFNDPSNFCKLFKRLVGITPGEFRRREMGSEQYEQLA